jgi:antitoxin HigA-1
LTIIEEHEMPRVRTHPGETLREEYLLPLGLSARALANAIGVPPNRISELVAERRGVTADTAMRLARHFRTTPEFWMNMQAGYDLSKARAETDYSSVPIRAA